MASADRLQRLLRLIEVLQSGRPRTSQQLADELGVGRRTIFRDLRIIREAGLEVHQASEREGFEIPRQLTLPLGELSQQEALSLLLISQELSGGETAIPFQRSAASAARKILRSLPRSVQDVVAEVGDRIQIRLDSVNPLPSAEPVYEELLRSLIGRTHVRITYRSFSEERSLTTLVSPYRIVFSRRSWYVIGRSSVHRAVRTFNVGRITALSHLDSRYDIPPRFSLDRYLGNAWHLIRGGDRDQAVVIRFTHKVGQNVAEVRWHKSQKLVWDEQGSLLFHATVDGLHEIMWWVLGYGDQAEVVEPPALRDMIRTHARNMSRLYGSPE